MTQPAEPRRRRSKRRIIALGALVIAASWTVPKLLDAAVTLAADQARRPLGASIFFATGLIIGMAIGYAIARNEAS